MKVTESEQLKILIDQSYNLESKAETIQEDGLSDDDRSQAVDSLKREYYAWQAIATRHVEESDRARFEDAFEGGTFTPRIKAFLGRPTEKSPFHDPANPITPYYVFPVATTFAPNIGSQRQILLKTLSSIPVTQGTQNEILRLTEVLRRLSSYLADLSKALDQQVIISNESDLQRHLLPLLRLLYDDVRPEDFVPDFGGARSRSDFFLPDPGIAVETKMTRKTLSAPKLRDELLVDFRQYANLGRVRGIVALVYDPDRRLTNPASLSDLSDLTADKPIFVLTVAGR